MYHLFSDADAPSIEMPPLRLSWLAPGARVTSDVKSRPLGRRSMNAELMFWPAALFFTSMSGDSAVIWTDSVKVPSSMARFNFNTCPSVSSTTSLLTGLKPESVAVSSYDPGDSDGNRNTPAPSVTAVEVPAALFASTVAPGRTPPELSFTMPSMDPLVSCAASGDAQRSKAIKAARVRARIGLVSS